MHGSYSNATPRPRRALVINSFKDDVLSDSDDELLKGVPMLSKGEKMDGQFFPLLSDF